MWRGRGFVGRSAREQVAAAYAVYGPKTLLVLARPAAAAQPQAQAQAAQAMQQQGQPQLPPMAVQEYVLLPSGAWQLSRWAAWGRLLGCCAAPG